MTPYLPDRFRDIETWVFDLDNTLYHPDAGLLDQVNVLMTRFIAGHLGLDDAAASAVRQDLWVRYGATLTGLMAEHGIDPAQFLDETHAIDLLHLTPDAVLSDALAALPGRRVIHTNGPRLHADRVLSALGLENAFDAVVTIEDTGLVPKPAVRAHRDAVDLLGLAPERAAMIEDTLRNLAVPREMGMATVWLRHDAEAGSNDEHHVTDDLLRFLRALA